MQAVVCDSVCDCGLCLCLVCPSLCVCVCVCACASVCVTMRRWDQDKYKFISMILLDDSSKTVFVSVYSGLPSFDSLQPVGCFCVRLECVQPSSLKLGSTYTTGIFIGWFDIRNLRRLWHWVLDTFSSTCRKVCADVCCRMLLTDADVCWRMLTYADVCWHMLTNVDKCRQVYGPWTTEADSVK